MDIIAERKLVSNDDWVAVANYYQEWSEEATVRKSTGVKRYFYEVLCEKNKKGTGTSTLAERTRRAQSIHRDILAKEATQSMGFPDEDEDIAGHYESDNDDIHEEDGDDCADFIGEVLSLFLLQKLTAALVQHSQNSQYSQQMQMMMQMMQQQQQQNQAMMMQMMSLLLTLTLHLLRSKMKEIINN